MAHRQSSATHTFYDILEAAHLDLNTPSCYSEQLTCHQQNSTPFIFIFKHICSTSLSMLIVKLLTWICYVAVISFLLPLESGGSQKPTEKEKQYVNPWKRYLKEQTASETFLTPSSWKWSLKWPLGASANLSKFLQKQVQESCTFSSHRRG